MNQTRMPVARASMALIVGIAAITLAACEKAQLLAPTNSSLSVTADAVTIPSSGSTRVQAMVLEQAGTAVQNGTTVRFTTNLGRVEPAEAQTRNGVATTTFFADGTSGIAQVRAVSGAASGGTGDTATNSVSITVGTAGVGDGGITLRANPATVPVAGGTVEIVASVVGANNAALNGVAVSFSADRGTLSATTATTNSSGEARVTLTTTRETIVQATIGSKTATVTVKIQPAATVTLAVATTSPIAGQPVRLTVTPASGTAPRVVINWGDGSDTDLGVVSTARDVTHVYDDPGAYGITATATENGDVNTNAVGVTVASRPSPTVVLTSPSNGTGTTANNFVFTVTPATGSAGIRGMTIDFGDGSSQGLGAITTASAVSHRYSEAGTYTVKATQTDGTGAETTGVVVVIVTP